MNNSGMYSRYRIVIGFVFMAAFSLMQAVWSFNFFGSQRFTTMADRVERAVRDYKKALLLSVYSKKSIAVPVKIQEKIVRTLEHTWHAARDIDKPHLSSALFLEQLVFDGLYSELTLAPRIRQQLPAPIAQAHERVKDALRVNARRMGRQSRALRQAHSVLRINQITVWFNQAVDEIERYLNAVNRQYTQIPYVYIGLDDMRYFNEQLNVLLRSGQLSGKSDELESAIRSINDQFNKKLVQLIVAVQAIMPRTYAQMADLLSTNLAEALVTLDNVYDYIGLDADRGRNMTKDEILQYIKDQRIALQIVDENTPSGRAWRQIYYIFEGYKKAYDIWLQGQEAFQTYQMQFEHAYSNFKKWTEELSLFIQEFDINQKMSYLNND